MTKLDNNFTHKIQDWLNTPADKRDIRQGAELLLAVSHNRALYNSVCAKPLKFAGKLVYELRKYLRIRLDNMSRADVAKLEAKVIPSVKPIVDSAAVITSDDEIPTDTGHRGRRADHADLPVEIQQLFDDNLRYYRQMVLLFNELKAMNHLKPCDRYEKVKMLDTVEREYRERLAAYDSFEVKPGQSVDDAVALATMPTDVADKRISAARKTLSKYKKMLPSLSADDPKRPEAEEKIAEAIKTIRSLGANVSFAMLDELSKLGVVITL